MFTNNIMARVVDDSEELDKGCTLGGKVEVALPPKTSETAEQGVTTVLIVEDDSIAMDAMMKIIAMGGHRVIGARDGLEALTLWEIERPHVVLMDVQMPQLDGLETTRRIRSREREIGGQVPIYGLTGHVSEEDINRCLAAGMTGHIGKPVNFKEVLEAIRRHQVN
jgi:two-component system sensor histidine kinase/response regulator